MNFKDLLLALALSLLTMLAIQRFWGPGDQATHDSTTATGQRFTAPAAGEQRPLNTEIDFIDTKPGKRVRDLQEVETDYAKFMFCDEGATLEHLEFKREQGGRVSYLTTVFPVSANEREKRAFLVALDEKTPFYYSLTGRTDDDSSVVLTYEAPCDGGSVSKTYTVFKHRCQMDLSITLTTKETADTVDHVRLFFPSPWLSQLGAKDTTMGLVDGQASGLKRTAVEKISFEGGFVRPTLFGAEDRYFIHALVKDTHDFAQRAYFMRRGDGQLNAILESGPVSAENRSWNLSFFLGPKEHERIALVDRRLDATLDFGWLAPISKMLLKLLNILDDYVHNYGWAIILFTILMKIVLLPLTWKGEKGMRQQQEMQKKLKYLESRYKNDKETLEREKADLIRKHGLSTIGGCLPMLLQLPIFFALNRLLMNSIELYNAPFLWMKNLAAPDPYYILPISVAGLMMLQSPFGDSKSRASMIAVALIFGGIMTTFPAGLALYFAVSTLLAIVLKRPGAALA